MDENATTCNLRRGHESMTINPHQFYFLFLNLPCVSRERESALLVQLLINGMPPAPSKSVSSFPVNWKLAEKYRGERNWNNFLLKIWQIKRSTKFPLFPTQGNKFLLLGSSSTSTSTGADDFSAQTVQCFLGIISWLLQLVPMVETRAGSLLDGWKPTRRQLSSLGTFNIATFSTALWRLWQICYCWGICLGMYRNSDETVVEDP